MSRNQMSRSQKLAAAVILYAIFAADAFIHVAAGDWAFPVVAAILAIVCTAVVYVLRVRRNRYEATA